MNDILQTANEAGTFTTLLKAISATGLTDILKGAGPFTLFAPTDSAFDDLPEGTLQELLDDPPTLAEVLTYHIVPGKVLAKAVRRMDSATTLQGEDLMISIDDTTMIDQAHITKEDIECNNGVIHIIDAVLVPDVEDYEDSDENEA